MFSPRRDTDLTQASRTVQLSEISRWITTADTLCTWCSCIAPSGRRRQLSAPSPHKVTACRRAARTPSQVWWPEVSKQMNYYVYTSLHMSVPPQCVQSSSSSSAGALSVLSDPPFLQPSKCQNAYSTLKAFSVLCDRVCILALRRPCTGGFNTHPVLFTLPLQGFDICPGIWFALNHPDCWVLI